MSRGCRGWARMPILMGSYFIGLVSGDGMKEKRSSKFTLNSKGIGVFKTTKMGKGFVSIDAWLTVLLFFLNLLSVELSFLYLCLTTFPQWISSAIIDFGISTTHSADCPIHHQIICHWTRNLICLTFDLNLPLHTFISAINKCNEFIFLAIETI